MKGGLTRWSIGIGIGHRRFGDIWGIEQVHSYDFDYDRVVVVDGEYEKDEMGESVGSCIVHVIQIFGGIGKLR